MHRDLRPFPLAEALRVLAGDAPRAVVMTMAVGQWDRLLSAAYASGFILLELDGEERPVRAYRKAEE